MGLVDGKIAIVTGGGQGIGEGVVYALCKEGAKVANLGRTFSKVEAVAKKAADRGFEVLPIKCDVSNADEVKAAVAQVVEKYGTVDILVNNAMTQKYAPLEVATAEEFWDSFNSVIIGSVNCMQACFPYLKEHGGSIINFGSSAGKMGVEGMASYATAKEAVMGLTRTAAVEWGKYNITVNAILPHGNSPAWEMTIKAYGEKAAEKMMEGYLLDRGYLRMGDPENDIGGVVAFLASPYASYMTGRELYPDGGKCMTR